MGVLSSTFSSENYGLPTNQHGQACWEWESGLAEVPVRGAAVNDIYELYFNQLLDR